MIWPPFFRCASATPNRTQLSLSLPQDVKNSSEDTENDHIVVVESSPQKSASGRDRNDSDVFNAAVCKQSL
jgi:hypothetical protein